MNDALVVTGRRSSPTQLRRRMGAIAQASAGELPLYVRRDEVHRALEQLAEEPEAHALIWFLWITGCRISEALGLRVGDLDFRGRVVKLATLKRRKPEQRMVPVPGELLGELAVLTRERKLDDGQVFPWRGRTQAWFVVSSALQAAGVEPERATPRALRHGHACHAVSNRVPLNIIQRALGHSSIAVTSIYLRVTGEDVREAYAAVEW